MKRVTILSCRSELAVPGVKRLSCDATVTVDSGRSARMQLQVDTGASVCVMSLSLARRHFKGTEVHATTTKLYGVGHQPLEVIGVLPVKITISERHTAAVDFYVVDTQAAEALLGLNALSKLGLTIHPDRGLIAQISTSPDPALHEAEELPAIAGYRHRIRLKASAEPTRYPLRRLPLSLRSEVSAELRRLLTEGIIERVDSSPWVSPIVVARKRSGDIRLCVDLRGPNSQIVDEVHPLPTLVELQSQLKGDYFSHLDVRCAYHQMELDPESKNITAFITHDGLFQYRRVPFGLASAGAAFQRLLDRLLEGIPGCCHYLDDIVVSGPNRQVHDQRLSLVKKRLGEANVTLNTNKSTEAKRSIKFCGYILSGEGVSPVDDHIRAIRDAPQPENARELRSFLGLCGWVAQFVHGYAEVTAPLFELLRKNVIFDWTESHTYAFQLLKTRIAQAKPLQPFDLERKTFVTTDASEKGAGAVLSQVDDQGAERVVAFWSRRFTSSEANYSVTEREALAAVQAVEKWRIYLWGRHFTLRTDHSALRSVLSARFSGRVGARVARWQARLIPFSYTVQYVPGHQLPGADALSRLPLDFAAEDEAAAADDDYEVIALLSEGENCVSREDLRTASRADEQLTAVRHCLHHGFPKSSKDCEPAVKPFFPIRHELSTDGELVIRAETQVVVPNSLRRDYLERAHSSHDGIARCKQLLRTVAWWPGLDADVTRIVSECERCRCSDKTLSGRVRTEPLQPVELPEQPWAQLGVDIVGPIPSAPADCRYAVTLIDYFSKWAEVGLMASTETVNIIRFLDGVWSREGYPGSLVSDNGTQFTSEEFKTYLDRRDIKHHRSSAYWPQGNGAVERFNRTFKSWLQDHHDGGIVERVRRLLANYRATPHCSTGYSPSVMLHGRVMRLKFPLLQHQMVPDENTFRRRVQTQQRRNKRHYDRRHAVRPSDLKPGDKVFVRRQGHLSKTTRRFSGPLQIICRRGPSFQLSDGTTRNPRHLVHAPIGQSSIENVPPNEPECEVPPSIPTETAGDEVLSSSMGRREAPGFPEVSSAESMVPTETPDDELPPSSRGRRRRRPAPLRDYVTE